MTDLQDEKKCYPIQTLEPEQWQRKINYNVNNKKKHDKQKNEITKQKNIIMSITRPE